VGSPGGRWVFWVHSAGGLTLAVLVSWKWRIVARSFLRRGAGVWAVAPAVLGVLFLAVIASGLLWSTVGLPRVPLPGYGRTTGLAAHALLALLLAPFFVAHVLLRWPRPRRADFAGRRALLRTFALAGGGILAWQALEALTAIASLPGADRRFTGSREDGSFTGNGFPRTNWLSDSTQRIAPGGWRLRVTGRVQRELTLSSADFDQLPRETKREVLDCTGGWYTTQDWTGVPLTALLDEADVRDGARSVVVRSQTGFARRFSLGAARGLLLATHTGGEELSPGHGFPVRLVAPGKRGYNWVKWVTDIEVSDTHPAWQPPLPLQ